MFSFLGRTALFLPVLACLAGCTPTPKPKGKSPLTPAQMSPDSVVLDIFFVRFPVGDPRANGPLWEELDELHFSASARRWFLRNGFRVGLAAGQVPGALAELLELQATPPQNDQQQEGQIARLDAEPVVVRRHLQLRAGKRSEIIASGIYEELPLLIREKGEVCGKTYPQAQALFATLAFPLPDGRVRVELTPELHYGEPKQQWEGRQGILRLVAGRSRCSFDEVDLQAILGPGQMLVMTSLPNRSGSLGHYFFREDSQGHTEQKLLVVRLAQTQHAPLFDAQSVLPLD